MLRPQPSFAPYLAEFIGTFALVFAGPGAAAVNAASNRAGRGLDIDGEYPDNGAEAAARTRPVHIDSRFAGISPEIMPRFGYFR